MSDGRGTALPQIRVHASAVPFAPAPPWDDVVSEGAYYLALLHLRADDGAFKGDLAGHYALDPATEAPMTFPDAFADQEHMGARCDLHAEFAVFDAAKSDETRPAVEFTSEEGCELGGGFDHDHSRQNGPAGNVPGYPEFILSYILKADDAAGRTIRKDNPIEVFHVTTLGVGFANRFLIVDDLIQVDRRDIVE